MKSVSSAQYKKIVAVAPARGRGLKLRRLQAEGFLESRPRKGAWIEILSTGLSALSTGVAPARGRGLKYAWQQHQLAVFLSPPQGGVD